MASFPEYTGTYKAQVLSTTLSDKNQKPQLVVKYGLLEIWGKPKGEEKKRWVDISAKGWEITGYLFLKDNKGDIQDNAIKQMARGFGYESAWGVEGWKRDYSGVLCQITVDTDNYNPQKPTKKVGWINHYDDSPDRTVAEMGESEVANMKSEIDSKLAALNIKPSKPVPRVAVGATAPAPSSAPPENKNPLTQDDLPF